MSGIGTLRVSISLEELTAIATPLSKTLYNGKFGPIFFGAIFQYLEKFYESFSQTSVIELFAEIFNGYNPLTIFAKKDPP